MLVKLAFAMQSLKKYLKKIIVMINKDGGGNNFWILWGDTALMRGDIELMGVPQSPPLGKTLLCIYKKGRKSNRCVSHSFNLFRYHCTDFILSKLSRKEPCNCCKLPTFKEKSICSKENIVLDSYDY